MAEQSAPEGQHEASPEDRLEAALDRIAKVIEAPDPVATEVADRLDRIITSLKDVLSKSGPHPGDKE